MTTRVAIVCLLPQYSKSWGAAVSILSALGNEDVLWLDSAVQPGGEVASGGVEEIIGAQQAHHPGVDGLAPYPQEDRSYHAALPVERGQPQLEGPAHPHGAVEPQEFLAGELERSRIERGAIDLGVERSKPPDRCLGARHPRAPHLTGPRQRL